MNLSLKIIFALVQATLPFQSAEVIAVAALFGSKVNRWFGLPERLWRNEARSAGEVDNAGGHHAQQIG